MSPGFRTLMSPEVVNSSYGFDELDPDQENNVATVYMRTDRRRAMHRSAVTMSTNPPATDARTHGLSTAFLESCQWQQVFDAQSTLPVLA